MEEEFARMPRYITDADTMRVLSEYYHHRTDVQMNALAEAISRVPTADVIEAPRWIPVTERLPETHGHYFIWVARGKGKLIGYDDIGYFGRGKFSWEHISQEWPEEVTHWMPLPKAPESDGE